VNGSGPSPFEEVASAVAHEVGTPLAVTRGLLRVLQRGDPGMDPAEVLDAALQQLALVEYQLVRLQRLDTEDWLTPQRAPVDLVGLASGLLGAFETTLLERHPTRLAAPGSLVAEVDADQIRQVLFNLLSNAAKYAPAGQEVVVEVAARGSAALVRVTDQGHGVAPPDAERIFEKYERATDERPGAGLGLYLARRIARAHGGELRVVPAQRTGGVFELSLPLEG
jgi:signal transduction histidine kinase